MKLITSIFAVLALSSLAIHAADDGKKGDKKGKGKGKGDPAEMFKKLDKDGNGSVSKEEYMASPMAKKDSAKAEESFGKRDKNGDGSLSMDEFKPKPKK